MPRRNLPETGLLRQDQLAQGGKQVQMHVAHRPFFQQIQTRLSGPS
jgi:hypothetical protein